MTLTGDVDALPDVGLAADGPATAALRARGIHDLRAAARHLRDLPYGRISDRDRPGLVLAEGRGTCTTKHALLAALAAEQGVDLALRLGLYAMCESNTPGVGAVLSRHGLADIPEAHCYVAWREQRIDVTRAVTAAVPIDRFLHEERIDASQIGAYKIDVHRRVLADWVARAQPALTLDQAWQIREACIAALSDPR